MSLCKWIALLLALSALLANGACAEEIRTARVSDVRGTLSVHGDDDDDISTIALNAVIQVDDTLWTDRDSQAELELEHGNWARLSEQTKLDVRGLGAAPEFRLWSGSVYFDLSDRQDRPFHLITPAGDLDISSDSIVRVDLGNDLDTRVSVWHGQVRLTPDEGEVVRLRSSERVYLDDHQPVGPERFDRDDRDAFDRYQRERMDYYADRPVPRELERDLLGARELRDNGSWVEVEQTRFWRPYPTADWRPYSRGYWSDVPGWGYTWVDYHPWGFTTSHYGRWLLHPVYGWLWYPGYVWGPGWVYWGTWGDYYGWAPLDPWGRPSYNGSGSFISFGLVIDARSWTFCHRDDFFHSRHHWLFTHGRRPFAGAREVQLVPSRFRPVRSFQTEIGIPRKHVRGLVTGKDDRPVRERVLDLERALPPRRQQAIQRRFNVTPGRDAERAAHPSESERLQRLPGVPFDPGRLLKGREAELRVQPKPPTVRLAQPVPTPRSGGSVRTGRDDPFRRSSPATGPVRLPRERAVPTIPRWTPNLPQRQGRPAPTTRTGTGTHRQRSQPSPTERRSPRVR
jgi:hypothetical protein